MARPDASRKGPATASLLFVYGSLLEGQQNGGLLHGQRRRPATVEGRLWMVPSGYPALVPEPGAVSVKGELVDVDAGHLAVLDVLEDVAHGLYTRRVLGVQLTDGTTVEAQIYCVTAAEARMRQYRPLKVDDWRRVSLRSRS